MTLDNLNLYVVIVAMFMEDALSSAPESALKVILLECLDLEEHFERVKSPYVSNELKFT